jgi:AmmeMemoRadiSam system protein A
MRQESLTEADRKLLLDLARRSLEAAVANTPAPGLAPHTLSPALMEPRACFVTLTKNGALRGCLGQLTPQSPLGQAVIEVAAKAALYDPRFPAVQTDELDQVQIEISVLTDPEPLNFVSPEDLLDKLRPLEHGVILRIGDRVGTFLPQVWEKVPDKTQFLDLLAAKTGSPASAWRGHGVEVSVYRVETLHEAGPRNGVVE